MLVAYEVSIDLIRSSASRRRVAGRARQRPRRSIAARRDERVLEPRRRLAPLEGRSAALLWIFERQRDGSSRRTRSRGGVGLGRRCRRAATTTRSSARLVVGPDALKRSRTGGGASEVSAETRRSSDSPTRVSWCRKLRGNVSRFCGTLASDRTDPRGWRAEALRGNTRRLRLRLRLRLRRPSYRSMRPRHDGKRSSRPARARCSRSRRSFWIDSPMHDASASASATWTAVAISATSAGAFPGVW